MLSSLFYYYYYFVCLFVYLFICVGSNFNTLLLSFTIRVTDVDTSSFIHVVIICQRFSADQCEHYVGTYLLNYRIYI